MKFVHITHHYIDGWGYQDNLLPEYQLRQGWDVTVISDNNHLLYMKDDRKTKEIISKGSTYEINGVKIRKIKCYLNTSDLSLMCSGLYKLLNKEAPDIILHHGLNSSTLIIAAIYKKQHPNIKLFVDNHADWINRSKNKVWNFLINKIMISTVVKIIGDGVDKYFGVTPMRVDYLHEEFLIPSSKIGFLPIGCDTISADSSPHSKADLRAIYNFSPDDFIIACGGKLDRSKGVIEIINACSKLSRIIPNIRLILFGKIDKEIQGMIDNSSMVSYMGWCDRYMTISLLKLSDVGCWPLLHTTLIEDAVSCGLPIVVKASRNVSHFQRCGNGVFLREGTEKEIEDAIFLIRDNYTVYFEKCRYAKRRYSYENIASYIISYPNTAFSFDSDYV